MHAYLITGGDGTARDNALAALLQRESIPPYARIALSCGESDKSIGITAVRDWMRLLSVSQPGAVTKAGIVIDAHTLTAEAQNAMLKTLEEPPPHTIIILMSATSDALLETIRSRCAWQRLSEPVPAAVDAPPAELTDPASPAGAWLAWVDREIKNRDAARTAIDGMLDWCRATLSGAASSADPSFRTAADLLPKLITARRDLAANANPKLVLDRLKTAARQAGQAQIG